MATRKKHARSRLKPLAKPTKKGKKTKKRARPSPAPRAPATRRGKVATPRRAAASSPRGKRLESSFSKGSAAQGPSRRTKSRVSGDRKLRSKTGGERVIPQATKPRKPSRATSSRSTPSRPARPTAHQKREHARRSAAAALGWQHRRARERKEAVAAQRAERFRQEQEGVFADIGRGVSEGRSYGQIRALLEAAEQTERVRFRRYEGIRLGLVRAMRDEPSFAKLQDLIRMTAEQTTLSERELYTLFYSPDAA